MENCKLPDARDRGGRADVRPAVGVLNRPAAFNYVAAGLTGPKTCLKGEGMPDQFSSQDYSYCTVDRAGNKGRHFGAVHLRARYL